MSAEPSPQLRIACDLGGKAQKVCRFGFPGQHAVLAMLNQLTRCRIVERQQREAAGHGFCCDISGDTWNVNPITLRRVERLFCRNERTVIHGRLAGQGQRVALVPVAAILVASIRLHFANVLLHLRYAGANRIDCDAAVSRGQELGWFEHGSTIIVLAPRGFTSCDGIQDGQRIAMGNRLLRLP